MSTVGSDRLVGRVLDQRYVLQEPIAVGGMATVYRGNDTRLNRRVAIKVMNPALALEPGFATRFTREAQAAASLNDPHVVSVFDQGEDDGLLFLVMEYVPGFTLRDRLQSRGRLPVPEALDILVDVLQGLAAAHRAGLVHRDVKPENVLIRDDGEVLVSDFGLARAAGEAAASAATSGLFLGTVAYVAPEQVQRRPTDQRCDVYATGIVLYEMLVGHPPFTGESAWDVAGQHVTHDVPPPSATVPGLPPSVDGLVASATAHDPRARPVDAAAMLTAVRAARRELPASPAATHATTHLLDLRRAAPDTRTLVVPTPFDGAGRRPTSVVPTASSTDPPDPAEPPRRRRWRGPVALLLVLLVALGVGAAAWWLGSGRLVPVPGVLGATKSQAEARLAEAGFEVKYSKPGFSEVVPSGRVLDSDPAAGQRASRGDAVVLVLSKGPERYDVPDLATVTLDVARQRLADRNLRLGRVKRAYSTSVPAGQVIRSSPPAGRPVRPDTAVIVTVSRGVPPVDVPDLSGRSYDEAATLLASLNLRIERKDQTYSDTVAEGAIVTQSPSANERRPQGSTVEVVVSLGPPLVTVPDVVDDPIGKAIAELRKAGFRYKVFAPFGVSPLNRVASQDPGGGSQAPRGSVVRLGII